MGKNLIKDTFEFKVNNCSMIAKEKSILKNVAKVLIKQNKDYIQKVFFGKREQGKVCKRPLILEISEAEEFNDFKCYEIYFTDTEISEKYLPTYLIKKKNLYISMYFNNQDPLPREKIPNVLFKECGDSFRNENCWVALICKNSYKFVVVDIGMVPYKATKQFQEFSCENKAQSNIKIENAIIDYDLLKKMMDGGIRAQ